MSTQIHCLVLFIQRKSRVLATDFTSVSFLTKESIVRGSISLGERNMNGIPDIFSLLETIGLSLVLKNPNTFTIIQNISILA